MGFSGTWSGGSPTAGGHRLPRSSGVSTGPRGGDEPQLRAWERRRKGGGRPSDFGRSWDCERRRYDPGHMRSETPGETGETRCESPCAVEPDI
jgi:hypothetical protein